MIQRRTVVVLLAFFLLFGGALTTSAPPAQAQSHTLYLPQILAPLRPNPYGIQSFAIRDTRLIPRARELQAHWLRHDLVSWSAIQPLRGGAYHWAAMVGVEADILAAQEAGLQPVLVVNDSPLWATIGNSTCGAIRADRFGDYAAFMAALVSRYSKPPWNIHHWEMGNEVDVDPRLVPPEAIWGCWGNIDDPWYGGEHYGNMLKAVVPAMRAADPYVKIWMGGLLLATHQTTDPALGKPENFLEGVLRAGAAPYIDFVPYHGHSSYISRYADHSGLNGGWTPWGGPAAGKPAFLRSVMQRYGVNKPLYFNEGSLGYTGTVPTGDFYQAQADHVSRAFVRALANGVSGAFWFTLEGPSWRFSGLLDANRNPQPSFLAYRTLVAKTGSATGAPTPFTYSATIESYRFPTGSSVTDVVWGRTAVPSLISIPQAKFISATDRDGNPITPTIIAGNATINVGWGTIYIQRQP